MVNRIKELETKAFREFKEKSAQFNAEQRQNNLKPDQSLFIRNKSGRPSQTKKNLSRAIKTANSTTESLFSEESNESEDSQDETDQGDYNQQDDAEDNSTEDEKLECNHLLNQCRHQFNQEMLERQDLELAGLRDGEETLDEDDDSLASDHGDGNQKEILTKQKMYKKKIASRPQTAKASSRPLTAASSRMSRGQK